VNYSRTDAPDIGWADLGDDADQPQRRQTGMEREVENYDPAALVAGLPPRDGTAGTPAAMASFDDDLGIRPEWHSAATPVPVAAAWSAVTSAIEAATEAERDERALDAEQAQAERVEAARVRKLVAAGKPAKPSAGRDFPAERRFSAAVAAGRREAARRARSDYEALVEQLRTAWSVQLVESLPSAKAQAIKALTEAGRMVEQLLASSEAAQTLLRVEHGSVVPLPVLPIRQCAASMQALAIEIDGSDQLGGVDLVRPAMTPSWADRAQIGASLLHGIVDSSTHWLAELERREQYRLSSFTRSVPLGPKPPETTQW